MAEWLRILQVHPGSEEARFEQGRIAERENLWHLLLLQPAWELAQKPGKPAQLRLLTQLADLYEGNLARPEYALRARVAAWKLNAAGVSVAPVAFSIVGRSSVPDQRVRRGSLLPRNWAPARALPRVAGLSAARFAGLTRPLAAVMATVWYSAA